MEINTVIDDVAATPLAQPGKIRTSPSSTTKFIERSLHDLDDLIQQRRLELSALRKSNRQRLNEQFSVVVSYIYVLSTCVSYLIYFLYRERHLSR